MVSDNIKSIVSYGLTLICFILLSVQQAYPSGEADGDEIAQKFINNVIQLTVELSNSKTEIKYGYGFVVAEENDNLFMVAPDHLVRSDDPDLKTKKITAQFFIEKGKSYEAKLLQLAIQGIDLALLRITKRPRTYKWEKKCINLNPQRRDEVWFIGRDRTWDVPLSPGLIRETADRIDRNHIAEISDVRPGTSGAPLFNRRGIIGMILEDESSEIAALSINIIKDIVLQKWNYPWQLEENNYDAGTFNSPPTLDGFVAIGTIFKIDSEFNLVYITLARSISNSGNLLVIAEDGTQTKMRIARVATKYATAVPENGIHNISQGDWVYIEK